MPISARFLHRAALACEALLLGGLALLMASQDRWALAAALAAMPAIWRLAYPAALLMLSFLFFRRPEGTLPLTPAWFRIVGRAAPSIWRNQWAMALHRDRPAPPPDAGRSNPLVLLIPGYACNPACFLTLPGRLQARGVESRAISLSNPLGDIKRMAAETIAWIEAAHRTEPLRPLILVGISMGGLVARAALAERPDLPVAYLLTISSPHAGTWMAWFGLAQAARQMRPGSDLIHGLNARPSGVPATAIWTPDDTIILPPDSGKLVGAETIAVAGYTHLAVVEAPEVERTIVGLCKRSLQALNQAP
jgi:triacylglycerol esterase/lipase EstA (alpha/beta hydrolase family)